VSPPLLIHPINHNAQDSQCSILPCPPSVTCEPTSHSHSQIPNYLTPTTTSYLYLFRACDHTHLRKFSSMSKNSLVSSRRISYSAPHSPVRLQSPHSQRCVTCTTCPDTCLYHIMSAAQSRTVSSISFLDIRKNSLHLSTIPFHVNHCPPDRKQPRGSKYQRIYV
jgi:hypothetical protein